MPQYTMEEYAALLTRTYVPRFPRDNRPRTVTDVTDKGEEVLEFILPNPVEGRFSLSLQVHTFKNAVSHCTLYFGQVEVATRLDPEEAVAVMDKVLADEVVAVNRYKNREAFEDHRRISNPPFEWLFRLPEEGDQLEALLELIRKPAGFWDRVSGKYVGVFEVFRWSGAEVLER